MVIAIFYIKEDGNFEGAKKYFLQAGYTECECYRSMIRMAWQSGRDREIDYYYINNNDKTGSALLACRLNSGNSDIILEYCLEIQKNSSFLYTTVYRELAEAYLKKANYDRAAECYSETDFAAEGYLQIAEACVLGRDYETALVYYRRIGREEEGYFTIAQACWDREKWKDAEAYFEKAGRPEGFLILTDDYLQRLKYEQAMQFYFKAGYSRDVIYTRVAEELLEKREYEKAEEYFKASGYTDEETNLLIMQACLQNKDTDRISNYYIWQISSQEHWKKAAAMFIEEGYHAFAQLCYNQIDDPAALKQAADSFYDIGQYASAGHFYSKIDDKAGLKKSAEICFQQEQYDTAADYYSQLDDKVGLEKVADLFFKKKYYASALKYYEKAGYAYEQVVVLKAQDWFTKGDCETADYFFDNITDLGILHDAAGQFLAADCFPLAAKYYVRTGHTEGTRKAADMCLEAGLYLDAGQYYAEISDKGGLKTVADLCLKKCHLAEAGEYYDLIGDKEGMRKVADLYLEQEVYTSAGKYYNIINDKKGLDMAADGCFTNEEYAAAARFHFGADNIPGLKKAVAQCMEQGLYVEARGYYSHFQWEYESIEDEVHLLVAFRRISNLEDIWDKAKQVLYEDLFSENEKICEFAARALIGMGDEESVPVLKEALIVNGTTDLVLFYYNYGNEELQQAASAWAESRGYEFVILPRPLDYSSGWGRW